jgi:cytochrome c oxidase subunit 4
MSDLNIIPDPLAPPHQEDNHEGMSTRTIWRVFWWLLAITIVEVVWGMKVSHTISEKWINAIFFLSMTFAKAAIIVAYFMHLRYELKYLIRSVCIPLLLFVWFVIAFCVDGTSWLNLRSRYEPHTPEKAKTETPASEGVLK